MAITFLLLEEYFATGDDRFADSLREFRIPGSLASLADKWKKDTRPWARKQVLCYLKEPLTASGHETVVKRLFKHFEETNNDDLMGAFAVAFDRQIRRKRRQKRQWDPEARQAFQVEYLIGPHDVAPTPSASAYRGPVVPDFKPAWDWPGRKLFSYRTRHYLRRRAWRYFRHMGYRRPSDYPKAVAGMLQRYDDADLALGENILDCWSLLHACFGESDVLEFNANYARLREGRTLRELNPAPVFPDLWKPETSGSILLDLLLDANARLVRVWAVGLLRQFHSTLLQSMPVAAIRRLLENPDEQVQLLGAQLLEASNQLDKLTVPEWLELLDVRNPSALDAIVLLMARHVRGERLDLSQCVALASAKAVPVARLGLQFLQGRDIRTDAERDLIATLADARSASVASALTQWALSHLGKPEAYRVDRIARFFDSLLRETRDAAWAWLTPASAGWNDPALWSRLVETPYDDARLHFVRALEQRMKAPGLDARSLVGVWSSVLLGIHRGGRHKLTALRQISDAIRQNPDSADTLLPVLAVAIRSVRPPEARGGLAAIVSAVEARPDLSPLVTRIFPELELSPHGVAQ